VATPNPQLSRQKLGRPDFGIAEPAHLAADVVFQDAIKRVATRMPEDHPGRILLDMPKVETRSEASVIKIVHSMLSSMEAARTSLRTKKAPSVAGGALLVVQSVTAYDQETTRRGWSSR
jgi:hypothetical protein